MKGLKMRILVTGGAGFIDTIFIRVFAVRSGGSWYFSIRREL